MKRILTLLAFVMLFCSSTIAQSFVITVTPQTQCFTSWSSVSATVQTPPPGANSYSWTIAGGSGTLCTNNFTSANTSAYFAPGCPGIYTLTCAGYSNNVFIAQTSQTLNLIAPSNVSVSGNSVLCTLGNSATLTATGATNYTWFPGGMVGSQVVVTPSTATNYSVFGASGSCGGSAATIFVSFQPTVLTINGSSNQCSNVYLQSSAQGGSQTWLPGNSTGSSFIANNVTPGVYCYTLNYSSSCGNLSATKCVTVQNVPTLTITGASTICAGQSATLTVSGATCACAP